VPTLYRVAFNSAALFFALALLPESGTYFAALRWHVSIVGLLLVVRAIDTRKFLWCVPGLATIYLWLPIFHVYLVRDLWVWLDAGFGIIYLIAAWVLGKPIKYVLLSVLNPPQLEDAMRDEAWKVRIFIAIEFILIYWLNY
jgi:hypothetical protein